MQLKQTQTRSTSHALCYYSSVLNEMLTHTNLSLYILHKTNHFSWCITEKTTRPPLVSHRLPLLPAFMNHKTNNNKQQEPGVINGGGNFKQMPVDFGRDPVGVKYRQPLTVNAPKASLSQSEACVCPWRPGGQRSSELKQIRGVERGWSPDTLINPAAQRKSSFTLNLHKNNQTLLSHHKPADVRSLTSAQFLTVNIIQSMRRR